tara:strand:+ start:362 stop:910 length:549 start_codon:yes stop_codon:yes gene_type:complete
MKKVIDIEHSDGPTEFQDVIESLLTEFGVNYEVVECDTRVMVLYTPPSTGYVPPTLYTHSSRLEKRIYEKWATTGFLAGLEWQEARLLAEIFEELANYMLLNGELDTTPWEVMIFPVTRKVFSAIGHTDRINLDIKLFVEKFVEFHDSHQDAVSKIVSDFTVDVEAELAALISEQLIDYITN